jgi:hypothetical protein
LHFNCIAVLQNICACYETSWTADVAKNCNIQALGVFNATSAMVAAGSDRSAQFTAVAVCFGAAAAIVASTSFTAFLHNLLSDSSRHPLPEGKQCDYGVVLGYALHRYGGCCGCCASESACKLLKTCIRFSMPKFYKLIIWRLTIRWQNTYVQNLRCRRIQAQPNARLAQQQQQQQ